MGKLSCQYNSFNSEDYALMITYEKKQTKKPILKWININKEWLKLEDLNSHYEL